MFRNILVPLDGTLFAEAALPVATRLARQSHGALHLLLSHKLVPSLVGLEPAVAAVSLESEVWEREHAYLVSTSGELALNGAGKVHYREAIGPAGPAVCEEAERVKADLVVIATHGRGPAGRLLHGGVADHVIRHLHVPVLLMRQPPRKRRPDASQLRNILVPLDLSPASEAILEPVRKLAELTGATITLMHVLTDPPGARIEKLGVDEKVANRVARGQRLEALGEPLREAGCTVCTRVVVGHDPGMTIRRIANNEHHDVLAITTHGYGGLRRLLLGSVADQLVQTVKTPMLVLRPE